MSANRPWESGPFSEWVIEELNNRIKYLSSGIIQSPANSNGAMNYKSGPRRHWLRLFSNGMNKTNGIDDDNNWGLLFKSGDSFASRYGISPQQQIYGYYNNGKPKYITSNQYRINVPEPGIVSFTVDVQKNFFASAKINWVCHSIDQLNAITPYLLTPLTTVFVEWGWNNFDVSSLIDYNSVQNLEKIINNHFDHYETKVPASKGNYEFVVGDITNFEYSLDDNIIRGFTEIKSRQMLYSGFNIRGQKTVNTVTSQNTDTPVLSFKTTCREILNSLSAFTDNGEFLTKSNFELPEQFKNKTQKPKTNTDKLSALLNGYSKYGVNLENLSNYIYKYINKAKSEPQTTQDGNNQSILLDTYITMELFVDIMNALKNQHKQDSFLKNFFEVNVTDTRIGYHPNLISTNRNVLIPNPRSPKFNGKDSLVYGQNDCDDSTTFVGDKLPSTFVTGETKVSEKGQFVDNQSMFEELVDRKITLNTYKQFPPNPNIQLKLLVGYRGNVYRNNLDYVLNYYGRNTDQSRKDQNGNEDTSFDKRGLLKNIYINLNFIIESIIVDDNIIDMKSMYDKVLAEINESVCDYWNLQLTNVNSIGPDTNQKDVGNRLQINDEKYKINTTKPDNIFTFDYGSNKSIIKKINFTTSLTNAMANQILYRSFGETSLSTNSLMDFSNGDLYVDRIKGSYKKQIDAPRSSETILTFLSVLGKYVKFAPNDPKASYLMRVQAYQKPQRGPVKRELVVTDEQRRIYGDKYGNVKEGQIPFGPFNPLKYKTVYEPIFDKYNIVDLYIPDKEALVYLLNDNDKKGNTNVYCAPIRNLELEMSLMGIAGIRVFEYFKVKNLPPPFTDDIVIFQVRDVSHTIDENGWETRIKASVRPSYNLSI